MSDEEQRTEQKHRAVMPGSSLCICGFRPGCGSRAQAAFEDHIRKASNDER